MDSSRKVQRNFRTYEKEKEMKKYTLDETWDNCLAMWKHISRRMLVSERFVSAEKRRWLKKHHIVSLQENCFFCEYANYYKGQGCSACPGALIDPNFRCLDDEYHCFNKPRAFYQELKRLNKIRLGRKEK